MSDAIQSREALTPIERHKFNDLESIIERGLQTFVEVGASLAMIREQRLYRESHETFEAYCQERWGWTRQRAHQLIGAHEVVSTIVDVDPPANEGQARALAPVPAEQRATVLEEARADAASEGKPVTAERIRETAHKYRPMKERAKKPAKPKHEKPEDAAAAVVAAAEERRRAARALTDESMAFARKLNEATEDGGEPDATAPEIEEAPQVDERDVPTAGQAEDGPRVQPPASDSPADVVLMVARSLVLPVVPYTREDVAVAALSLSQEDIARIRETRDLCSALMTEYARRTHAA